MEADVQCTFRPVSATGSVADKDLEEKCRAVVAQARSREVNMTVPKQPSKGEET